MHEQLDKHLLGNSLSAKECKFHFALRTRMVEVKNNYNEKYLDMSCPCCHHEEDTQAHMLTCPMLGVEVELLRSIPSYKYIC